LADAADPVVYLEAYYPHTSPAFLFASLSLFGVLTAAFGLWLGFAFWPITLILGLVTLYLAAVAIRQARGVALAVRVTDHGIYHAAWESGLVRRGLPGGEIPLDSIGSVEIVNLRSAAGGGPVVAIWLRNPGSYRTGRPLIRLARQMAGAGDLSIACDETDRTADQVLQAIEAALADHLKGQGEPGR
jgi:hypothetical protein